MHTKTNMKKILAGIALTAMLLSGVANIAQADFGDVLSGDQEFGDWAGNAVEDIGGWLSSGSSGPTTSFVDFKGGLQAPSAEGYAPSLTQAQDARSFVLNVTNFILGFLGLTAVIVIIYGGFVYVTAAGDEGKTEKGKKSVTFAIIGILMILGSFAIVNTVLQAPKGTDTPDKGSAEEQGTSGTNVRRRFNVLASRVQELAQDILVAFKFHFDSIKDITEAKTLMKEANDHINNCSQNGCGDNWGDGLYDALLVWRTKADSAIAKLQRIKTVVPSQLQNSLSIRSSIDDSVAYIDKYWNDAIDRASSKADENGCDDNIFKSCDGDDSGGSENRAVFAAFKSTAYDEKYVTNAEKAVMGNFKSTINDAKMKLKAMYEQVSLITDVASTAFTKLVDSTFLQKDTLALSPQDIDSASGSLNVVKDEVAKATSDTQLTNDTSPLKELRQAIIDMGALYTILKDILFVDAKITASVVEGNAPLVVNFSSVGSLDPSGITITEKQIAWDLDGDGTYGEGEIGATPSPELTVMYCDEGTNKSDNIAKSGDSAKVELVSTSGPISTSCVYTKPGTYRAKLKIKSTNTQNPATGKTFDQEIGAGLATIDINVKPAQTRINLKITNTNSLLGLDVMKYSADGVLQADRQEVVFPLSKAKTDGVVFDASLTKDKDNADFTSQSAAGATVLWDFGNNANDGVNKVLQPASNLKPAAAKYTEAGDYNVSLELTDKNKIVDRKLFTLKISSIVPYIQLSKSHANVGDIVEFDAGNSTSDNGQIKTYAWTVSPPPEGLSAEELSKEKFSYKFTKPGKFTVKLTVDDEVEEPVSISEELYVTSKPPVAQFTYTVPDEHEPATYVFDGTRSYDPDQNDPTKKLNYRWEVNGSVLSGGASGTGTNISYTNGDTASPKITFAQKGEYRVTLVASDPEGGGPGAPQDSNAVEKVVNVEKVIGVSWDPAAADKNTIILADDTSTPEVDQKAEATFTLKSKNAVAYDIDFGDGETEQGDFPPAKPIAHMYKEVGTYVVKASVFDKDDEENSVTRKVYVGSDKQPIAAISVQVNGEDVVPDAVEPLEVNRKDVVTLSAKDSKNVDGTGRRLVYSWKLGDGELSAKESATKTFKNIGEYTIELAAKNANDLSMLAGTDTLKINVVGQKPNLKTITAVPTGSTLTTPVTVALTAVGAEDPDGKVIRYRWWYFDPSNPDDQLGVQVTTVPSANVIIGTRGSEGEEKKYQFGVELTDDENNSVKSADIIDTQSTELAVINGPNKAPVAKFNVDRTNVYVGESAVFTSSSTDPDGTIKTYLWDWEGDGFANNKDEGPNVTHIFDKPAKDGIKVRLQVVDSNESPAISDSVVIYVDSKAAAPVAAFTSTQDGTSKKMSFKNNTTYDKENGVNITSTVWDFDVNIDSNGDGKKDNDQDAVGADTVSYEYPDYGIYRAKLTVTDSNNQTSQVANFVNVKAAPAPAPAPAPTPAPTPKPAAPPPTPPPTPAPVTTALDARLLTIPETSFTDGKIHLKGESGTVTLDYSTSAGKIKTYVIDKNVYYDTNGNNVKEDDEDYKSTSAGKWTTEFFKSYGNIKVRLTVIGEDGKKDYVEKEIVFDKDTAATLGSASIFGTEADTAVILLVSLGGFGILSLNLYRTKNKKTNA